MFNKRRLGGDARAVRDSYIAQRTQATVELMMEEAIAASSAESFWPRQARCQCCSVYAPDGCLIPPGADPRQRGKRCRYGDCQCWGGDVGICGDCASSLNGRGVEGMRVVDPLEWAARQPPRGWK